MNKPLRDTMTFCIFEKMQEPIIANKRYWKQEASFKSKEDVQVKTGSQLKNTY